MGIVLSTPAGLDPANLSTVEVSTGSLAGGASVAVTVTFPRAFPDTSYTVVASIVEATAGNDTLRVHHIQSKTTTGVVVRVVNDNTLTAKTGTLQVLAIRG
jgi:hypothetical protein